MLDNSTQKYRCNSFFDDNIPLVNNTLEITPLKTDSSLINRRDDVTDTANGEWVHMVMDRLHAVENALEIANIRLQFVEQELTNAKQQHRWDCIYNTVNTVYNALIRCPNGLIFHRMLPPQVIDILIEDVYILQDITNRMHALSLTKSGLIDMQCNPDAELFQQPRFDHLRPIMLIALNPSIKESELCYFEKKFRHYICQCKKCIQFQDRDSIRFV